MITNAFSLFAQSLEPRLYSNVPTDLNFLVVGYAHSTGALPSMQDLDLKDSNLALNVGVLAYVRGINLYGKSATINIVIPTVKMHGDAIVNGTFMSKDVKGMGDIKARVSVNLLGSPALKLKDFKNYKQDTIVGVSLQVTAPTGKYEEEKLLNIGQNIWAVKIGAGLSKAIGKFTFEFLADGEFYTQNKQYYNSTTKKIDPIYSGQMHIIYSMPKGMWVGFNSNYYWGGNTYIDGVDKHTSLSNSRAGFVFSVPLNKANSIKIDYHDGVSTRAGTNFKSGMISWQYRFRDGT